MHSILLLVIGFVALQAASASDVLTYTDATFESKIGEHDVALAEFYAPWCGHCKKLAPEFEIAATALKANDPPVSLIQVDCTVETATCQKYGVSGYPTLKIFKNGEPTDYQGPREADGIIKYMRTKAGPVSKELTTLAEAEKFLSHNDQSIIGFFKDGGSALATEFKKTADQLAENFRFAHTTSAEILAKYNHNDEVVIYQPSRLQVKLEATENVYTTGGIKNFIQSQVHGICGHRTTGNMKDFQQSGSLVVVNFNVDYVRDIKGTNYVRNRVIKVAQKLKGEGLPVNFAISNADEFKQQLGEFGITDDKMDNAGKYVIALGARGQKYVMASEYSPAALEQFARDLIDGKVEQYLKSEEIPASQPDAVRTVVAKQFDEIVNDETKDVLIEFYAPWCGHCKTLAPKYEELAQKLKSETDIVIAKMDATANDVPGNFAVQGFPTLFFVPKNGKQAPRKYEGGREVADFIAYLAKHSTVPLKNFDRSGKKTTKEDL